ncbi:hypothetical protein A6F55_09065 [Prescottella equi]|nr:hypothetical protein A6F55_09065 [Prescottella equi]
MGADGPTALAVLMSREADLHVMQLMQASPLWEGPAGLSNSSRRSIRGIGTAMPVAVGVAPVARMWDFFVSWIRDEFVSAVALPIWSNVR